MWRLGAPARRAPHDPDASGRAGRSHREHDVKHDAVAPVAAETENRLFAVNLRSGRVIRRIAMPADPENVVSTGGLAVVVSPAARRVTVLDLGSPRKVRAVRRFDSQLRSRRLVHLAPATRDLVISAG